MTSRQIRFRAVFSGAILAVMFVVLAGCDERVLGGAAVGAVAGAVIMDSVNDRDRDRRYRYYRAPRGYSAPPPRGYYRDPPRYRHRYHRAPCYDRYGRPMYRCR